MSHISKEHLEIFRQYFLSHNEDAKRDLLALLPGTVLKYLLIIEDGFLSNNSIEQIAINIESQNLEPELKLLQIDYFKSLAQLYAQGEYNQEIELLLANGNLVFENVLYEISEEQRFEKDIIAAIKITERTSFKNKFSMIDQEDELFLPETEIKSAITQLERESLKHKFIEIDEFQNGEPVTTRRKVVSYNFKHIIKYAAAAMLAGLIFGGSYYIIKNTGSVGNDMAIHVNKKEIMKPPPSLVIPVIDEQNNQLPLLMPQSFGFAEVDKIYVSITIQDIGKQIAMLKKIYSQGFDMKNTSVNPNTAKLLTRQIDSLVAIGNTYSYDPVSFKVVLRMLDGQNIAKIININPAQKRSLYLKLNKYYYKLKKTDSPNRLIQVEDKTTIEELDKIIFQNQ